MSSKLGKNNHYTFEDYPDTLQYPNIEKLMEERLLNRELKKLIRIKKNREKMKRLNVVPYAYSNSQQIVFIENK